MARRLQILVLAALVGALVLSACGRSPEGAKEKEYKRGGTLHVGVAGRGIPIDDKGFPYLDPTQDAERGQFRCCLLRTLMTFNGHPTNQQGTEAVPDLSEGMPKVSADGLEWTFHIRSGITYAPPLQKVHVTAQDFVRALKRIYKKEDERFSGGPPFFTGVIQGAQEYADGKAASILGLEVPNERTLVVRLVHPQGDLGIRFSQPSTAPIPPSPFNPGAPYGIAEDHDNYGPFIAATGPYMIEGADKLDYAVPAAKQVSPTGYAYPKKITFVRNPSWHSDTIRKAYVDRIEMTFNGSDRVFEKEIDAGTIDIVLDASSPDTQVERYLNDPSLKDRAFVYPNDDLFAMTMNLAAPPFDDVHVRKATNFALDKSAIMKLPLPAYKQIATHVATDSLEGNLLTTYDPYRSPNGAGDVEKAKEEMKQSRYDANHDGICDAAACRKIQFVVRNPSQFCGASSGCPAGRAAPALAASLKRIGLDLVISEPEDFYAEIFDPSKHIPITYGLGWKKDFPSASNFFDDLFRRSGGDVSLLGYSPAELRELGYSVTIVPTIEQKFVECSARIGAEQTRCWATLDQYLMEQVVPWVPLINEFTGRVVSANVIHYGWDQAYATPAIDQIALRVAA